MEHQLSLLGQASPPAHAHKKSSSRKGETQQNTETWKLFIDGASRGNPGLSGAGIYITCNDKPLVEKGIFLGTRTNNQAEYLALALGLFFLQQKLSVSAKGVVGLKKEASIVVTSDSELLVRQMKKIYRIKDRTLQKIKQLIDTLLKDFSPAFEHVLRINNKKADALANQGIDEKTAMPKEFQELLKRYVTPQG